MIIRTNARHFDLEQANATLPLVRRIVCDIREDNEALQELLPRLKAARTRPATAGRADIDDTARLDRLRGQVAEITSRFECYLGELAQIGCVYRGTTGHVDFRGEHEGRPVFYCWAPGETRISHLHLLGSDCRLREPVGHGAALPLGR